MSSWSLLFKSDDDQTRPDNSTPRSSFNSSGSVIKEAISQHFRGVAAFLAPPPHQHHEKTDTATTLTSSPTISGIKNDLAEIEESFKSSLSLLSTKLTSSFLPFSNNNHNYKDDKKDSEEDEGGEEEYDDGDEDVAGINEEVVNFVRALSYRPEFWTDFPLNLSIDYGMSDCQREHCASIEDLVPGLVSLREKHCSHLSDGQFWMIYYTILLPRLNENDRKHLLTPEIVEVRETLVQKLEDNEKMCGFEDVGRVNSEDSDVSGFKRGESSEWIQLTEKKGAKASLQGKDSEGESSSDWHHVNDVDCESLVSD